MKPLFILLFSSFSLFGQVIIKERLEIQPKLKIPLQATSTPDSTTTWIDIYYDYPHSGWNYWPLYWGVTLLEVNGSVDTISLRGKFDGYSRIDWNNGTVIGPVPLGTTGEIKHYNGPEYNYGSPPNQTYPIATFTYIVKNPPIGNDIASYEVWGNYAGSYKLHGTLRYIPVPQPTVVITNTKIKKYTINSTSPNYTPTFTCYATPAGKYAPTITWTPQQTFNTQNYLNQIKPGDTLQIPVTVTTTNIAGAAADTTGKLILIRHKELHHIKVFATPDSIRQSDSSLITIKAYRLDNTDITSTLPGNMRVSFTLSNSGGTLNSYNCSLDSAVNNQIKFRPNPMATGITKTKVFATLDGKYTDDTTVTIKGCPTPIPMCGNNILFPQEFDEGWFETYKEGDIFTWVDKNGVQKNTIVSACDYNPDNEDISGILGLTCGLPTVNLDKKNPFYNPGIEGFVPNVCLDNTNPSKPLWRYRFTDIRLPIFVSTCVRPGFIDMGSTDAEWNAKVTNMNIYRKVLEAMNWWVEGSYTHKKQYPLYMYIFKEMTMIHENVHLIKRKEKYRKEFIEAFAKIHYDINTGRDIYPCLEDAKASWTEARGKALDAITKASTGNKTKKEKEQEEMEADALASPERKTLLNKFKTWAITQSWYR